MRKFSLLFFLACLAFLAPAARAQSVVDSVLIDVRVASWTHPTFPTCGSSILATFPDVKGRVLNQTTSFNSYQFVATEGEWVNVWFPDVRDFPGQPGIVPEGYYGFIVAGGSGDNRKCAEFRAAAEFLASGAQTILNGRPFRMVDWYARYSLPKGTPVARFTWEQSKALDVDFDGSFASGLSHEVELPENIDVAEYSWDLGDGSTSSLSSFSHTYDDTGTYEVTLTVTDDDGETNAITKIVDVTGVLLKYSAELDSDTKTFTEGEEFTLRTTISNEGTEDATEVRIPRMYAFSNFFPDGSFKGKQKADLKEQTDTDEFVTPLSVGTSKTVDVTFLIERSARHRFERIWNAFSVDIQSTLFGTITGKDTFGDLATVVDLCEKRECNDKFRIEPVLTSELKFADATTASGKEFGFWVEIINHGDERVNNVQIWGEPQVFDVFYDPLAPAGNTPPVLTPVDGTGPTSLGEIGPGGTTSIFFKYKVGAAAKNAANEPIPSTIFAASNRIEGDYKGVNIYAGCRSGRDRPGDRGRCEDSLRVEVGELTVEILYENNTGEVTEAPSGRRRTRGIFGNWITDHRLTRSGEGVLCISGCVNITVTVTDDAGAPVEGAIVELSALPITGDAVVTPDQGGGFFCTPEVVATCKAKLELDPTDTEGKGKAFFWFPGLIESAQTTVTATAEKDGVAGDVGKDLTMSPTKVSIGLSSIIPSFGDNLGLASAEAMRKVLNVPNLLSAGCKNVGKWMLQKPSVALDGEFIRGVDFATDFVCGKVMSGVGGVLDQSLDLLPLFGAGSKLAEFAEIYWFFDNFQVPGVGLSTITVASPGPPFIDIQSDFTGAINASLGKYVNTMLTAALPRTMTFDIFETSYHKIVLGTDDAIPALYFRFRASANGGSAVDHKALIQLGYRPGFWLTEDGISLASVSSPSSAGDTSLPLSGAASKAGLSQVRLDSLFSAGHVVAINPGSDVEEHVQVVSVSENSLELTSPLHYDHAAGEFVNRVDSLLLGPPGAPLATGLSAGLPGAPTEPVLAWRSRAPATSYEVHVARDSLFASLEVNASGIIADSLQLNTLNEGVKYYWRVRGVNNLGVGPWSIRYAFIPGRPPTDNLAAAKSMTESGDSSLVRWLIGASSEPGESVPSCGSSGNSIWAMFVPVRSGPVAAHTLGSSFDTVLSVWTGTQHPLSEIVCNDNWNTSDGKRFEQSAVEFNAVAGQTYYLRISGVESSEGLANLSVVEALPVLVESGDVDPAPAAFRLGAFPNPVQSSGTVVLTIPNRGHVAVAIYDLLGRRIAVLADEPMAAGTHSLTFDGHRLSSGVYLVRAVFGNTVTTKQITLVR